MHFRACLAALAALGAVCLFGENYYYGGQTATGRLSRTAIVNLTQAASSGLRLRSFSVKPGGPEIKRNIVEPQSRAVKTLRALRTLTAASTPSLNVSGTSTAFHFLGLTHYDQRNANNGNQFSVEPPSPEIAAAKGWVVEGVNNAIQVYSAATGAPLLAKALSTNELFAVSPAIDRMSLIYGVFPTDMRVFYDHGIDRWFILQRAQDYDMFSGLPAATSHLYLAVSQTGDPTGNYTIYTMDTTNPSHPGCPCFSDFPQIGADQYGVYISSDEYDSYYGRFIDVAILAISKASLAAGDASPRMQEIVVPQGTGFEGTVRPAITPPGASYALLRGGVEFFISTRVSGADNRFGLWALTNTASLNTTPNLTLIQTVIPGIAYVFPDVATQKPGPLSYGSTLFPPGQLAWIHGGRDSRVLSLIYAGGRLSLTMATDVTDENGRHLVAGAYAVLFPYLRDQLLGAPLWRGGYLQVKGNHVLRPAVAVNAQGKGAIAVTLVGPDYYPSAAFIPVNDFTPATTLQIASPGVGPEDGFTGYPDLGYVTTGIARWGDYSGAVVAPDGSIWMITEYIPAAPRTELANWGTRIIRHLP